ncbi:hypothetical protein SCORR_v1c06800 [Spiroplasma corruscae]|uniref:DUF262 domain-containing protein n=1 Tax=Spiroplasma corruscae TaxID=216934 RepID=A0A222EPS8_9MOLU|nr:DUF262 domain-containing protein [Spiroplasma corruscae]ASP28452.1 hypothetical protein SCORR_v1c06800 [Spiroplasma corruscae]
MIEATNTFIEKELKELNELYIIPVFQRNYSWTTKECEQLFSDLLLTNNEYKHFIGIIILQRINNDLTRSSQNIIIDGQQRITTIFILIKALHDLCTNHNDSESLRSYLYMEDKKTKKIKLNKEDDITFKYLLNDDFDKIKIGSRIFSNYIFFKNKFSKLIEEEKFKIDEFSKLISKLIFVRVQINIDDNPQLIFERINSTGVELSTSDLIRNYLLMTNYSEELYENYWYELEKLFDNKNLNSFIHHYIMYKTNKSIPDSKVYSEFKKFLTVNDIPNEEVLKDLKKVSKLYAILLQVVPFPNSKINKVIRDLLVFKQRTCFPFIINILNDYYIDLIDQDTLYDCLLLIRNYILRRLIVDKVAKNLNKLFVDLYVKIFDKIENKKNYYDAIWSYFIQIKSTDRYPGDIDVKKSFQISNMYSNRQLCKYILYEIEHFNSKEKIIYDENITIEHIMPQNLSSEWKQYLGPDYSLIHSQFLHTIGNLSLTGYNSNLKDYSFKRKKSILIEKSSRFNHINKLIFESECWNEDAIINRSNFLWENFINIFCNKEPRIKIIYDSLNQPEQTLEDFEDVNGTNISYFELNGNRFYTKNWSEMLKLTLEELFKENSEKMISLALQNYSFKNNGTVDISFDKSKIKRFNEIHDTKVYYNRNYTPNEMLILIRNLFDLYGIDNNNFKFVNKIIKNNDYN